MSSTFIIAHYAIGESLNPRIFAPYPALNLALGLCYNGFNPGWLDGCASALVGVRKVRAPQGTVLANCQAG